MKRITVILADDFTLIRQELRALLAHEGDIQVVGEAETGRQAVEMTTALRPDVLVMDISLPLLNGLEATRQIHRTVPSVKVLVLSAHSDRAYIEQAVRLGAAGYVTKHNAAEVLPWAIRQVAGGAVVFEDGISMVRHSCFQESFTLRLERAASIIRRPRLCMS